MKCQPTTAASGVRQAAWLLALTALALCLRLVGLDGPSFKLWDDFFALRLGVLDPADILATLRHQSFDPYQEFQPPLYYFLMRAFLAFGHTDVLARMTGVLAGALSVPALYLFGRRFVGSQAAWLAALMLAVSLYHIEYSQQTRNYVTFLFFALCSMHCFATWLTERRASVLPWYALTTALMFYASYMATVAAAAQALCFVLVVLTGREGSLAARLRAQLPFVAAGLGAVLLFAPWLPVYAGMYQALKSITGGMRPPVLDTLWLTFKEFTSFHCAFLGYPEAAWPMAALCLAGLVLVARDKQRGRGLIPLVWAGVTLVMVFGFNRQGLHVRTRHLIAILPLVYLLTGAGLWAASSRLAGLTRRPGLAMAVALAAIVALNSFNFRALPFYYRREDDRLKELCHEMGAYARGAERAMFWGSDSKWFPAVADFVLSWYLPGVFKTPDETHDRRYMRAWMLSSPDHRGQLEALGAAVRRAHYGYVDLYWAGVVNTSPLVARLGPGPSAFAFQEDFASPSSLGRVHHMENVFMDKGRAGLRNLDRPGQLTYALKLPQGADCLSLRLDVTARFLADVSGVPASRLRVQAAPAGGEFTEVLDLSFAELAARPGSGFDQRKLVVSQDIELPASILAQGEGLVRLVLDPGPDKGVVLLEKLIFAAQGSGPGHLPSQARLELDNVLANTAVAPWRPGSHAPMGALYAFATGPDKNAPASVGDATAHQAFQAAHPGLPPVLTLGAPGAGYALYDPALAEPPLPLAELAKTRAPAASLALGGAWAAPGEWRLPGVSGVPSWLNISADGKGVLTARPVIRRNAPGAFATTLSEGARLSPGEDCLTCKDASPCYAVFKMSAPNGFSDLSVVAYPRLYSDLALKNVYRVSVSTNGRDFETLDTMRSNASLRWDGWRVPRGAGKKWALPVTEIYLRIDLSGDGVQLWSTPEHPMRLEAGLTPLAAPNAWPQSPDTGDGKAQPLERATGRFTNLLQSY